jgi:hypothetical protein
MIRKLASGKYRLYSRKVNPKTGKRRNLGTFASRAEARARRAIFQAGVMLSPPQPGLLRPTRKQRDRQRERVFARKKP